MGNVVVVVGATGHIGHALSGRLLDAGVKVRAVGRSADRLQSLEKRGAEAHAGSLSDRSFLVKTFRGADAVFAMIPPDYKTADHIAYQRATADHIAEAVKEAGVTRAIALSSVGGEGSSPMGPITGLHAFEERMSAVPGLHLVVLRPAGFMENNLGSIGLIKSAGFNGSPMKGDVKQAMIATQDIATAAAEYLASPTFTGRSVRYLLGPRDYTFTEATRILGAAIGKPDLEYVELPYEDMRKGLVAHGFSDNVAGLFIEMERAFNEGRIQVEARSAANTTPTTLEDFARTVFAPAFGV